MRPRPVPLTALERAPKAGQQRFELKYWVPEPMTEIVTSFARAYLERDPHQLANGQRVSSLYLDSPGLDFYHAHRDERPDRAKLRVRVYGEGLRGPAFFELKRKVKSVIVKRRAAVPVRDVASLLSGNHAALALLPREQDRKNLETFLYLMSVQHAAPTLLISCMREAYASTFEVDDVRVTIDRQIAYQPVVGPDLRGDPRRFVALGPGARAGSGPLALVELKFRGMAPAWMESLVRALRVERSSFSKYVSSVKSDLSELLAVDARALSMWS